MGWFYNKSITLMGETDGHMDRGVWVKGTPIEVKTISCDVQPASREQIYKDYGYYIECSQRVFCDVDNDFKAGSLVKYDGEQYKIAKVVKWDTFMDIFIQNVDGDSNG